MKRGLIPQQIGFAEKVRPQGEITIAWRQFIADQIERDERAYYRAGEERPLVGEIQVSTPNSFSLRRFVKSITP